jgi:hypothetical protein
MEVDHAETPTLITGVSVTLFQFAVFLRHPVRRPTLTAFKSNLNQRR